MLVSTVSTGGLLFLLSWLIVAGIVIAAALAAYRAAWLPALALAVIAIIAAAVLLGNG